MDLKNISWNLKWLEVVKWSEFKKCYEKRLFTNSEQPERDTYYLYKHLTGRSVVSLEKKYA